MTSHSFSSIGFTIEHKIMNPVSQKGVVQDDGGFVIIQGTFDYSVTECGMFPYNAMDNITFSILSLPLTHYHMCMLLRLCLLKINRCRSSYSFRVIYLCRLNKSSEKTHIWLSIFMYSFNYILYSYAGCCSQSQL